MVLVLAVAPGIFWLWFFYRKDKLEPEPKSLIIQTFLWGMVSVIPIAIVQVLIPLPDPLGAIVVAPITEEIGKYLVVRWTVYNHPEFDEPMDGVIYAVAAALGFASLENVLYLFGEYHETGSVLGIFIVRSVLSVPGHALDSSLWGFGLGMAKFAPPERRSTIIRNGLILGILLHGIFNGLLTIAPIAALGMLILVPVSWRMTNRRIMAALTGSPHHTPPRSVPSGEDPGSLTRRPPSLSSSSLAHGSDPIPLQHSQFGITALVLGLAAMAAWAGAMGLGVYAEMNLAGGLEQDSSLAFMVGLLILLAIPVNLAGIILAIVGLLHSQRKKLFPLLGLLTNLGPLLLIGLLILISLTT
jgi:RsiW-degrading membrane proteinase PrsW (M82 family)